MRRNSNLELCLVPPSPSILSDHHLHYRRQNPSEGMNATGEDSYSTEKQSNQLTIFYDGNVSICDVTEVQGRAIIKIASAKMEGKGRKTPGSTTSSEPMTSPPIGGQGGLSMRRSLQRFLQKRKHRIQATSPHHPPSLHY